MHGSQLHFTVCGVPLVLIHGAGQAAGPQPHCTGLPGLTACCRLPPTPSWAHGASSTRARFPLLRAQVPQPGTAAPAPSTAAPQGQAGGRRNGPQPIRERGALRAPRPAAAPSQSATPFSPPVTGSAHRLRRGTRSDRGPPARPPHRRDRHRGKSPSAGTGGRPRGAEPLLSPHLARVAARRGAARSQRVCRRAMASGNELSGLASGHHTLRAPVSRPAPRVRRPDARRCRHSPPGGQEVSVQPRRPPRPALCWGGLGCTGTWRGRLGRGAPPWAIANQAILGRTGA